MINIAKYLTTPNAKTSPIWFRVNTKGNYTRLSSGLKIETKYWNNNTKKISISANNVKSINKELANLEHQIYLIAEKCTNENGSIDLEKLSIFYRDAMNGRDSNEDTILLRDAFDIYINHCLNLSVKSEGTAAVYKTVKKQVISFENSINQQYNLTEIDRNYLERFRLYLQIECDITNITVHKYFKVLKSFTRFMEQEGFKVNKDVFGVVIQYTDTNKVVINNQDMAKLKKVELKTPNQNKYRDLFLILCHIGIRVSDLHNLNESHLDMEKEIISIYTEKTNVPVCIPIPKDVLELIKKYFIDNKTTIIDQKFNRIIKEVCKLAGINEQVEVVIENGKNSSRNVSPKYKLITTHTGRRTFITKMMDTTRFSEKELMKITGHKTVSSFKKYYQILPENLLSKCKEVMDKGLFED